MMNMDQGPAETVELTVPARAEFVRLVRLVMAGIGNSLDFNVEEIDDLKMAVSEAFNMFRPLGGAPAPHPHVHLPGRAGGEGIAALPGRRDAVRGDGQPPWRRGSASCS